MKFPYRAAVPTVLVLVYLVSRLFYWLMGVRFDATTLTWYFQYLDVRLLQHDLLRSAFFLHGQPPLFNLFLGSVLKMFSGVGQIAFHLSYMIAGLVMYCALYSLLRNLTGKKWLSLALATLFATSPEILIYENWLFYPYFVCVLLTLIVWCFHAYLGTQKAIYLALFFGLVTVLCFTRSAFHLIYLLGCVVFVCWISRAQWKSVICVALPALLLVTGLYAKNAYFFDNFSGSSWLGMNLWKIARKSLSDAELEELKGQAAIPYFVSKETAWRWNSGSYPTEFHEVPPRFKHLPVLTHVHKENGAPNLHHYGYIALSKEYLQVSKTVIQRYPARYLGSVMDSWAIYLSSSLEFPHLEKNRNRVEPLIGWHSFLFDRGKVDLRPLEERLFGTRTSRSVPLFSLLLFPCIVLAGVWFGLSKRVASWGISKQTRDVCLFCVGTIVYVAVICNATEHGENFRFRFVTSPLYFLVLSVCVITLCRRFRHDSPKRG